MLKKKETTLTERGPLMKHKKELTKKGYIKLLILGVSLFLLFLAMLAVAAIL